MLHSALCLVQHWLSTDRVAPCTLLYRFGRPPGVPTRTNPGNYHEIQCAKNPSFFAHRVRECTKNDNGFGSHLLPVHSGGLQSHIEHAFNLYYCPRSCITVMREPKVICPFQNKSSRFSVAMLVYIWVLLASAGSVYDLYVFNCLPCARPAVSSLG